MARWLLPLLLLLAAPAPAWGALEGTDWEFARAQGRAFNGDPQWIQLRADGSFVGRLNCNTYSGTYRERGRRLRLRLVKSTAVGCDDPGPSAVRAVERTRRFRMTAKRLYLRDGEGRRLAVLRRR
jgi:heat shock protein HslJ